MRNHELVPGQGAGADLSVGYDKAASQMVLPDGRTTIVLDAATLEKKREFRSFAGTTRNCSGSVTP